MEDAVEVVATRQQPGAGPSRSGAVKATAPGRPQPGRRRSLQARQQPDRQQDFIDLTDDREDDEVQITKVQSAKRRRMAAAAAAPAPLSHDPVPAPAQRPEAPPSPKGYKCIICLERMEADMATTHCGHMFCYKCISAWVQKSGNCPQCRTKVTKSKIIRVYPPT